MNLDPFRFIDFAKHWIGVLKLERVDILMNEITLRGITLKKNSIFFRKEFPMKFKTKLWKRSAQSFATTIPHIALLSMDEKSNYEVVWEYSESVRRWTFSLRELSKRKSKKDPSLLKSSNPAAALAIRGGGSS